MFQQLQALLATFKGAQTVTRSAVDPKGAGEDLAKFAMSAALTSAGQSTGFSSLNYSGAKDFRTEFLKNV
jgi:hypothetical protein